MMKKNVIEERPYNYTNINYFLKNKKAEKRENSKSNSPYPDFSVKLSIDYFTLSINKNADQYTLKNILTSIGFISVSNRKLDKGNNDKSNYEMIWTFKNNDGIVAHVLYHPKLPYIPSLSLKIHDPSEKIVNLLHQSFKSHIIYPKLSFVELTFDFFTDEMTRLREFLESSAFMKNARTKPCRIKTTFYLNNIRKSDRGMRIYTRPEWKKVRMEVTLKSPILKRLGVSFPFASIDSLDLSRFFSFQALNQERLMEYLIWSNRKMIAEIERKDSRLGNLVICQLTSFLNCIFYGDHGRITALMEQIVEIKSKNGIQNYVRFMEPLVEFSEEFKKQIAGQSFLH